MSDFQQTIDLTMFGCPMHTIKARDAIKQCPDGQTLTFCLNDDAVDTICRNLTADGCQVSIVAANHGTTTIEVTK